jgi:CCR4-NOT transcriptional regulation complex NOT5 subunit
LVILLVFQIKTFVVTPLKLLTEYIKSRIEIHDKKGDKFFKIFSRYNNKKLDGERVNEINRLVYLFLRFFKLNDFGECSELVYIMNEENT